MAGSAAGLERLDGQGAIGGDGGGGEVTVAHVFGVGPAHPVGRVGVVGGLVVGVAVQRLPVGALSGTGRGGG
jgi:hypothetical protein